MNFKKLFLMLTFFVLLGTTAFAQTTYYVNNSTGNDGRNGFSATNQDDGVTGPKRTINNAMSVAASGDVISVAATATAYSTGTGEPGTITTKIGAGSITDKKFTFQSSGGTPEVSSLFVVENPSNAPANQVTVTFAGPFKFSGGFTVKQGSISGASFLTLSGIVTRYAYANISDPTFDAEPALTGTAHLYYESANDDGGGLEAITAGPEFTTSAQFSNLNLGAVAGVALKLSGDRTVKGVLTTANGSTINLNSATLTISGTSAAHATAGDITNGTMAFSMTDDVTVTGNFKLPHITATYTPSSGHTQKTLTLNSNVLVLSLTSNSYANIISSAVAVNAAGNTTDVIVANSFGNIRTAAQNVYGNVKALGSFGSIVYTTASWEDGIGGDAAGTIVFTAGAAITVTGSVTNSTSYTVLSTSTNTDSQILNTGIYGNITFPDQAVTIKKDVSVQVTFTGAIKSGATEADNNGMIVFSNTTTNLTIEGAVINNSSTNISSSTNASAVFNIGSIHALTTTGDIRADGGITNSSNWSGLTGTGITNNGRINFNVGTRTGGAGESSFGTSAKKVGAVVNSSVAKNASGNGDIIIGNGLEFIGTSVTVSGSASGGVTAFGNEDCSFSGSVTNSRNADVTASSNPAGNQLVFGSLATAGVVLTISGDLVNNNSNAIEIKAPADFGGAGNIVVVTGKIENSGKGKIIFNGAANATATANLGLDFGTMVLSLGTIDMTGAAGAGSDADYKVTVGNVNLTGGKLQLGTAAAAATVTVDGNTNVIGAAGANPTFTVNGAVVLSFVAPSPTSIQTVTFGGAEPIWPGVLTVNNSSGLTVATAFSGGNFRVTGNLNFLVGAVSIDNAAIYTAGDFTNNGGYTTTGVARVAMTGTARALQGSGDFGDFEAFAQASVINVVGTTVFTQRFYLTAGDVRNNGDTGNSSNVEFDNSDVFPTIIVNAGTFAVAGAGTPTFTSMVNISYIGADKSSSNELPVATDKLNNVTIATTTGAAAGKGIVTFTQSTNVNGTLTVNANQTLLIAPTKTLTLLGESAVVNGYVTNAGAANFAGPNNVIVLAAETGTDITGSGTLCDILVDVDSDSNTVSGPVGLVNQFLGAGLVWGGGDDFDTSNEFADGSIEFGAGLASLTTTLGSGFKSGTQVNDITTVNKDNLLTINGNLVLAGDLVHGDGTINLQDNKLTVGAGQTGSTHSVGADAIFEGTGSLEFKNSAVGNSTLASASGASIDVPVTLNLANNSDKLTVNTAALTISKPVTITKGNLELNSNVTLTDATLTVTSNGSVTAVGAEQLISNPAEGTLTISIPRGTAYTLPTLTVKDSTAFSYTGTSGAGATVAGLKHDGGLLTLGGFDLTVNGAYTRTDGTYSAGSEYLVLKGTVAQGIGASIPNLAIVNTGNVTIADDKDFTVTGNFKLDVGAGNKFNHKPSAAARLNVAAGATMTFVSGDLDVAAVLGGAINIVAANAATGAVPTNFWPSSISVTKFIVNASGFSVYLPGNRTVLDELGLYAGTLDLTNNSRELTLANSTIRVRAGVINYTSSAGKFIVTNAPAMIYELGAAYSTTKELLATVASITVTRSSNVANALLTIGSDVTVTGDLSIKNNFAMAANKALNIAGDVTIEKDSFSNATTPTITFPSTSPITFMGADSQTLTFTGATAIDNLQLDMTGTNPVLNVVGGNLDTRDGTITFINGILNVGNNQLIMERPEDATDDGLGYNRDAVTGSNVGHVVGKIKRHANTDDGNGSNGRFAFPVGSLDGQYRPVFITFGPNYPVINGVDIIVANADSSAEGTKNLPLDGGGVSIGNYPPFYWYISTSPTSLSHQQQFDLDLQASNIGYPYESDQDLRIIRRQDGSAVSNGWSMQGTAANYSNYQVIEDTDTTVIVRTSSAQGGLVAQGSRFTIGIPTRAPRFTAPVAETLSINEGASTTLTFTADPQDIGETVTYALVNPPAWATIVASTGVVTLAPGYDVGSATAYDIVVRATDSGNAFSEKTVEVTVVNMNRAPDFTATGGAAPATGTVKNGETLSLTYIAVDSDPSTTLTYTSTVTPEPAGVNAIAAGVLTFTPTFADAGKTFTFTVIASDGVAADTAATVVTVGYAKAKGDVNLSGSITAADATPILEYVVGKITLTAEQLYYANVNGDASVGALDAAWVLYMALHDGQTPPIAKAIAASGSVEFGKFGSVNGEFTLPIKLAKTNGVVSVYSEIQLGNGIEFKGIAGKLPEGWIMSSNFDNGLLKIAMAGIDPLNDGQIAVVNLALTNKEAVVSVEGSAKLNDYVESSLQSIKVREIPTEFALSQNYPNPFNPTTSIKYSISQNASVQLIVYNMLGQVVKTLVNVEQEAGYYTIQWNGTNDFGGKVASGIYIYRIVAGDFTSTIKMNLLK